MNGSDMDHEFVESARQALRRSARADALDALTWWELLDHFADPEARAAIFALFRAQGLELATTGALGALMAEPYLALLGLNRRSLAVTTPFDSAHRGYVPLMIGHVDADYLLLDEPGTGARLVAVSEADLRPIELSGRLGLQEVIVDPARRHAAAIDEAWASTMRHRSRYLGRVACAYEILGAAEAAMGLALAHAEARSQFGRPIGTFQAVRHLLAWGSTETTALRALCQLAVELDDQAPPRHDEIVKAVAGRNGRRACEHALQVLGGIGFTTEHDHHHFHGRVLALDAVLGSAAALTRDLGVWLRTDRVDPRIPATALYGGDL